MKKLFLFLFVIGFSQFLNAQCPIIYTYDVAGNRIQRTSPNCITGGGSDDRSEVPESTVQPEITVFPNPSSAEITIAGKEISPNAVVRFFDSETRLVYERKLEDGIFDTSAWAAGMYWIQILDQESTQIIRFVKSHP